MPEIQIILTIFCLVYKNELCAIAQKDKTTNKLLTKRFLYHEKIYNINGNAIIFYACICS